MLVLSRDLGEQVVIGHDVTLTVVGIEGNRIKLAIQAPIEKTVLRQELHPGARNAGNDFSAGSIESI